MSLSPNRFRRTTTALSALILSATCVTFAACSTDDSTNGNTPFQGLGGKDATVDGMGTGDSGPIGQPLCGTYGGYTFVQKLAKDIDTAAKADCRIGAWFTGLTSEQSTHLSECFQKQLGTFFQCPGVTYDVDSKGNPCRDMRRAHQDMNLRSADFDAFRDDVIATMQADKMSDNDITSIVPTFIGLEQSVVSQQGDGNAMCSCANLMTPDGGYCGIPDGGTDADSGDDGGTDASNDAGTIDDTGTGADTGDDGSADAATE